MSKPQTYTKQNMVRIFVSVAVFLSVFSTTMYPALGNSDSGGNLLLPGYGYTVDYYRSYGEPTIEASIIGDTELGRGETADLQVMLENKGIIEGMKRLNANQNLIPDSKEENIAVAEMTAEQDCTTAKGIEATLTSESKYIHVESTTTPQNVDELKTGNIKPIKFSVRVDSDTPAGEYELELPVTYEYQSNVRTETSKSANLGVANSAGFTQQSSTLGFAQEYTTRNVTIPLHVSIKKEPKFEVSEVSGSLKQDSTSKINVTYTNVGDTVAEDAQAKIAVMKPLSTTTSIFRLGSIEPGESRTASFDISADSESVVKNYSIDSEIKYINDDGDTEISDNIKVNAPLEKAESSVSVTYIVIIAIALIFVYQAVKALRNRRKYSENESGDEND